MASGFFAILDDIAALMDDVSITAKVATKKTAGILGDDLAVNAEKSTGFVSSRELPVLWAITKGSFINKLIIVPIALLLNTFLPIAIKIILVLGGFFLAYEGVEKIIEYFFHPKTDEGKHTPEVLLEDASAEKTKIKSAITTDFILSVEIVIIALSTVLDRSLGIQILTTAAVSIIATIGVYGLVALIVRMDDAGFQLINYSKGKGFLNSLGNFLVKTLPVIIKSFAVIGTIALILVAGGIFEHNIPNLHHYLTQVPALAKEFGYGLAGGFLVWIAFVSIKKIISVIKKQG